MISTNDSTGLLNILCVPHLYPVSVTAPTRPMIIITSSMNIVHKIVCAGTPAVRSKSRSSKGVVMNLNGC